jgi:hypothetical protein
VVRQLLVVGILSIGLVAIPAYAGEAAKPTADLRLQVVELARTVDLSRGKEEFLALTVEVSGAEPTRMRRVQPERSDFQVRAGKAILPCRWLRGGTVPEDPTRLRFTLGFSLPPASIRRVTLLANLPRLEGEEALELKFTDLALGQTSGERVGPGWNVTIQRFAEEAYVPPALPKPGQFVSKAGPVDARIFRKSAPKEKEPQRAVVLSFRSNTVALYEAALDVSGTLMLEGGATLPLLSASLRRDPSATVKKPIYPPIVRAEFYFPAPAKGRVTGVLLRLHRRPANAPRKPVQIADLPVPGR